MKHDYKTIRTDDYSGQEIKKCIHCGRELVTEIGMRVLDSELHGCKKKK